MQRIIKQLLEGKQNQSISYDQAKQIACHDDTAVRAALANRNDTQAEILYFLTDDESAEVRREIAANPSTPRQADYKLAQDRDDEVRCELAGKIARLVPDLPTSEHDRIREMTIEILEIFAQDQLPRVRQIVAEEIKHAKAVPHALVQSLARDAELVVSAPILEYSPLLSDEDLLDVISSGPVEGALSVVANRREVTAPVSDAIVETKDSAAIGTLLANTSAQIREDTLDRIVEAAPEQEVWHEPLAQRPELTVRAVRRIANFVARSVLHILEDRHDLPSEATSEIAQAVARRFQDSGVEGGLDSEERAKRAFETGGLDDDAVIEALDRGDRDFVVAALSLLAGVEAKFVRKIFMSKSAKAVTGLGWQAGLSMRTSIQLQLRGAKIPTTELLNAKNGVDYPLDEEELKWQFELSTA